MSVGKYEIKRILEVRKVDGAKNKMEYLVDWEPTWVYEKDMDAHLLDDYYLTVEVLGPLHSPENLQKSSIKDMDLVIQRQNKSSTATTGEVILELLPYEQVKKWYPEELFTYMENAFSLPEDICAPIKGCNNATNSKKSRKKKHSGARKLSR